MTPTGIEVLRDLRANLESEPAAVLPAVLLQIEPDSTAAKIAALLPQLTPEAAGDVLAVTRFLTIKQEVTQ